MIIESPTITVGQTPAFLKAHLSNPANLEPLLPTEHVQNFKADGDQCEFKVTGGFSVVIKHEAHPDPLRVAYVSQRGTPIRFELEVVMEPVGESSSTLQIRCDADLNPFMKMMAEKPLQSIFSGMASAAESAFPA